MTAQQLRNSILQDAIQGKLVPQDPADEPASVDIDKSLYKGKITVLEEAEYPFEIPANWCFCRLQDVAATIGGYAFKSEELKGNIGTRVIRISDVTPKGFSNKNVVRYSRDLLLEQYEVHNNDILIAMTGGTVGKSLYVDYLPERLLLNQRVAIVRAENIYPLYLDLVIKAPLTQDIVSERKNSTNDNISMIDIKSFIIPLPPLAEQKRIVAKLEELLPLVEKYGKAQEELDKLNKDLPQKLRQSILQDAIQGKLVPQDPAEGTAVELLHQIQSSKPLTSKTNGRKGLIAESVEIETFDVPESWSWLRMGDFLTTQTGLAYSKSDLEKKVQNPIRVLRGGNIKSGSWCTKSDDVMIAPEFVKKDISLLRNTFITPAVTSLEHLGKTALIKEDHPDIVAGGFVLYLIPNDRKQDVLIKYLSYFFQSSYYNNFCKSIANKSGQAFWNLSRNKLLELQIPLPPLAEQKRIVAKVEELFAEIDKLK